MLGNLLRDNLFYFCKRHRPEVVVVYPDVILGGEEIRKSRDIQSLVRQRSGMYMAEQLPHPPVGSSIAEEGVVIQDDGLSAHTDGHLLGNMGEAPHETLFDLLEIMVPEDEIDLAVKLAEDIVPLPGAGEGEVPEVEDHPVRRNRLVPAAHQLTVHLLDVLEGTGTKLQDVLVIKVRIRSEPDVIGFECAVDIADALDQPGIMLWQGAASVAIVDNNLVPFLHNPFCLSILSNLSVYRRSWVSVPRNE